MKPITGCAVDLSAKRDPLSREQCPKRVQNLFVTIKTGETNDRESKLD